MGRRSLRLRCSSEKVSARLIGSHRTAHQRNAVLGRNGLALACLQCSVTDREKERESMTVV